MHRLPLSLGRTRTPSIPGKQNLVPPLTTSISTAFSERSTKTLTGPTGLSVTVQAEYQISTGLRNKIISNSRQIRKPGSRWRLLLWFGSHFLVSSCDHIHQLNTISHHQVQASLPVTNIRINLRLIFDAQGDGVFSDHASLRVCSTSMSTNLQPSSGFERIPNTASDWRQAFAIEAPFDLQMVLLSISVLTYGGEAVEYHVVSECNFREARLLLISFL